MPLQQGSIIWVRVVDRNGRNSKCRPAVIVTPTAEIVPGARLIAVAATSTLSRPIPQNQIELPWHNNGHPKTGLYKRCVAICDWLFEFDQDAIEDSPGIVPPAILRNILANIPDDPGGILLQPPE
ncbi:MAG: hypothetical protein EXS05_19575 [Planctomycetaceae bacterium]|nr:hypothetical protein [Planctomycetaceae bacterium]